MATKLRTGQEPDTFLSIDQACTRYGISRSTFYRMLHDGRGLDDVVVRIPPVTGRIKVPARAFEEWLQTANR